ncbi:MAG: ABC transporter substrate binding protein [Sulfurospirillaceae bacterium]|nr:ABC transporter substrate binding protein [Sulfurospirillaceae bacterium]MDD2825978.1 ABC transporter substrate binding protein [Sulfurospirillaceae bacterium]
MIRFLVLLLCFLSLHAYEAKEILLLHSYNKGLKWTDGISSGVEAVMNEKNDYELTTEYMDSKKIDSPEYLQELFELYVKKFSKRKYEAIIVADNYAYEFALKYHNELFSNTPIVFCGVENFNSQSITPELKHYVTGVIEYKDIRSNLQLIYHLFPSLKMVYIISDDSYSSLAIERQIINESNEFKDKFNVVFDNKIDFDTIDEKIEKLPKHSAILFTSFYKDMHGTYIPYNKLQAFFLRTKFPIFALNKIHLNEGIIGGNMVNPYDQGYSATKKVFQIIEGKKPADIPIEILASHLYFDNNILKRFNISLNEIPATATIINNSKSFYEEHQRFVENAFAILPFLVILFAILILNIIKRMTLEKELVRQNKLDHVLLNNIQSAIFWKRNDGIVVGCNDLLCRLAEKDRNAIIGHHVSEIMPEVCSKIGKVPTNSTMSEEVQVELKTGEKLDFAVRRTFYNDETNKEAGIVTILTDITDKKRIDTERKRHEQFVIQRSKQSEVGEMIASIAHQWKTPLVEISSIAQELLYKRRKKALDEEDTKLFVDDIMTQVKYMSQTIDDFRKFIKPSTVKTTFDIREAIHNLLSVVNHNVKYNYITIRISQDTQDSLLVYGYPNEFKQCILNIINNAKDSILKKREHQKTEGIIDINLSADEKNIYLSIRDDGFGIESNKLESIFDPFMSTKEHGDGFGLYMARLIIEDKMGGKIVARQQAVGAQIVITIQKRDHETISS